MQGINIINCRNKTIEIFVIVFVALVLSDKMTFEWENSDCSKNYGMLYTIDRESVTKTTNDSIITIVREMETHASGICEVTMTLDSLVNTTDASEAVGFAEDSYLWSHNALVRQGSVGFHLNGKLMINGSQIQASESLKQGDVVSFIINLDSMRFSLLVNSSEIYEGVVPFSTPIRFACCFRRTGIKLTATFPAKKSKSKLDRSSPICQSRIGSLTDISSGVILRQAASTHQEVHFPSLGPLFNVLLSPTQAEFLQFLQQNEINIELSSSLSSSTTVAAAVSVKMGDSSEEYTDPLNVQADIFLSLIENMIPRNEDFNLGLFLLAAKSLW